MNHRARSESAKKIEISIPSVPKLATPKLQPAAWTKVSIITPADKQALLNEIKENPKIENRTRQKSNLERAREQEMVSKGSPSNGHFPKIKKSVQMV